jgi:diguanylate cyclase (GGDEF)-like protein
MKNGEKSILKNKAFVIIAGFVVTVFIGILDYLTGNELSFSIFYLIPILIATWFAGRKAGVFLSLASSISWFLSDIFAKDKCSHYLIPYWNAFVGLNFFLITSLILSSLKAALERESDLARTDSLTGVENARSFYETADREIERMRRYRQPFSVAYIDLDNFKTVNDTFGHSTGDDLLRVVAETLNRELRKTDDAARLGGDEFAILMPETDEKTAPQVMNRILAKLAESMAANNWPVTFSTGLATFNKPPNTVDETIKTADSLMFEAKKNGKNKIRHEVVS